MPICKLFAEKYATFNSIVVDLVGTVAWMSFV